MTEEERKAREAWAQFQKALSELEKVDERATEAMMSEVSGFETDWWGGRG